MMAVSILNNSKYCILFYKVKYYSTDPLSRSHSFVLTIFLCELLRLFNSQFTLLQIINTMHEIGDQTKKPNTLSNFSPIH